MRFDLFCSRRAWAPLLFACLLVTLSGCSDVADEGDSDHFFNLSSRPCDGVWRDSNVDGSWLTTTIDYVPRFG